jgi:RNA polymerase sigma-70 factor (ECF subfamily)
MLRQYPGVKQWEDTDDVAQNARMRLWKALKRVEITSVAHFYRLAALHIRRELIDLARYYYGPQGAGKHEVQNRVAWQARQESEELIEPPDFAEDPERLARWSDFHEVADAMPEEDREVFDLLWYQGLLQAEAAEILGISERTLKRRWQRVRVRFCQALQGEPPE